jgi:hypothetical protein
MPSPASSKEKYSFGIDRAFINHHIERIENILPGVQRRAGLPGARISGEIGAAKFR